LSVLPQCGGCKTLSIPRVQKPLLKGSVQPNNGRKSNTSEETPSSGVNNPRNTLKPVFHLLFYEGLWEIFGYFNANYSLMLHFHPDCASAKPAQTWCLLKAAPQCLTFFSFSLTAPQHFQNLLHLLRTTAELVEAAACGEDLD